MIKKWIQKNYMITNPFWKYFLWKIIIGGHKIDRGGLEKGLKVFNDIHSENFWGSRESVSGPGSELLYTQNLRKFLPKFIDKYQINSMLDAPCGDCNWVKMVDFPDGFFYKGGDIVNELFLEKAVFNNPKINTDFFQIDITSNLLPTVDLWLCRDVLFHLSNSKVIETLKNFERSKISWLMTTHFADVKENIDISTGGYRPINLTRPPFKLPQPKILIDDFVIPFPPRQLAIWNKSEIQKALAELN